MYKNRLIAYGDITMDVIAQKSARGDAAEDEKVDDLHISPGGSAVNCAVVASTLGLPATFLGIVGDDAWSKLLEKDMKDHGVDTRHLHHVHGKLAVCISILAQNGDRKFYSYRGVNDLPSYPEIPESVFKDRQYLHLSGYSFQTPNSSAVATKLLLGAKKYGLKVSLDPSFLFAQSIDLESSPLLASVDYFFPSREEAYQLTKLRDPLAAARKIRAHGVGTVIVTLDKDGCLLVGENIEQFIKLEVHEPVVDTTGAGDAFCGGFLFAAANGLPLDSACKVASAAAAYTISRYGGHEDPPRVADLVRILLMNKETQLIEELKQITQPGTWWRRK
jgi:sugar/nucleoside kinase (ribokinase family)